MGKITRAAAAVAGAAVLVGTATACQPAPPANNVAVAQVAGKAVTSQNPAMSADGRYVVYISLVPDIVPGFAPGQPTAYRYDRVDKKTVAVSVAANGGSSASSTPFNAPENLSISDDGRYVAFSHGATNLVAAPAAGLDVYVRDVQAGTTTRVSKNSSGVAGNGEDRYPEISANGRWVSFRSTSTNLGPADAADDESDVYRWDRTTGAVVRVSVGRGPGGTVVEADGPSSISIPLDDGRVAFASYAKNLIPGNTLSPVDNILYLADPTTRAIDIVGKGQTGNIVYASLSDISPDGRHLVFATASANVVTGDTNRNIDVFVRDNQTGAVELAIAARDGSAPGGADGTISADGRYVALRASASNLVAGDTNASPDAFVKDRTTGTVYRANRRYNGSEGGGIEQVGGISGDGRTIVFQSVVAYTPGAMATTSKTYVAPTGRP